MKVFERTTTEQMTGLKYAGWLCLNVILILIALVSVKFFGEHKLAPTTTGLSGLLAQPRVDLLLIGSSHTRKSYDMRLLEQKSHLSNSFLITYNGMDMSAMAEALDYLAAHPEHRPRYVVVDAYCLLIAHAPDIEAPEMYFDAPPEMKVSLLRSYIQSRPLRSSTLDVFDLVVNRGNDEIFAFPLYRWATRSSSYRGGRTDFYFPGMSAEQFQNLQLPVNETMPNARQMAALEHIMDLAQKNRIALIFIDTPLPLPVSRNPRLLTLKKDFETAVVARGFPYLDADTFFPNGDAAYFSDNNHLSSEGREVFTHLIAQKLDDWVANNGQSALQ